ncbi:MAG TPA: hypothetical protein VL221_04240 [Bacteroidota bacterium]|nr:hypothetical protein [Bacteroidota bacterium]
MQRARSGSVRLVVVLAVALTAVRCSKDDIPTTPAPPFIITEVAISKFVNPPATTALKAGTIQKIRFDVNYTLASEDDARRANLSVIVAAFRTDVDTIVGSVSFVPTGSGGTVPDSLIANIPSGVTELQLDGAVIYSPLDTVVAFSYGPYWTVN